jgi:hypothetical protein
MIVPDFIDRLRWRIGPHLGAGGSIACALALLAFGALQYLMPPSFPPPRWGHNSAGAEHYRRALSLGSLQPVGDAAFRAWFRALLITAWAGYAAALFGGLLGGAPRASRCLPLIAALAFATAVGCPASLSYDCYAYVAFARMPVVYGLNPYFCTPKDLVPLGDPTGPIVGTCEMPSVYGPVWTILSAGLIAGLQHASLWWQVAGVKLVAAASLVLGAVAGSAVAGYYCPGRGPLALLAIGLNPLLVIEGPINGHNDLLMMALLLGGAVLWIRGWPAAGDLVLGLSVGIKFLPIVVLPWVLRERPRRGGVADIRLAVLACVLALGPTALAYVPFWRGAATFSVQAQRIQWGAPGRDLEALGAVGRWLSSAGLPAPAGRIVGLVIGQWPLIDAYVVLSLWVLWRRVPGRWLDAWVMLTFGFVFWTMAVRYPWYLSWSLMACLTRWDRLGMCISASWLVAAFSMSLDYAGPP